MSDMTLYTAVEDRAQAVALFEAAGVLLQKAEKYGEIANDGDAAIIGELRAHLNKTSKDLDNERLGMTAGLRETMAKINDKFNAKIEQLDAQVDRIDKVLRAHIAKKRREQEEVRLQQERALHEQQAREREVQRLKDEAEARALAARQTGDAEAAKAAQADVQAAQELVEETAAAAPQLPTVPPPDPTRIVGTYGSSTKLRENWRYKVVDIAKVPEPFLIAPEERVNKAVLNSMARSLRRAATVPGIEFFDEGAIGSTVPR